MKTDAIREALKAAGSGESFPIKKLLEPSPDLAAIISKLVPSRDPVGHDSRGNRTVEVPNLHQFRETTERTAQNIRDAATATEMLPELEFAGRLLVSAILSPNDLKTIELTYTAPESNLPSVVEAAMVDRLKTFFDKDYKITGVLPQLLYKSIVSEGSYPVVVLPENAIDDIINGNRSYTTEALSSEILPDGRIVGKGILGPGISDEPRTVKISQRFVLESLENVRREKRPVHSETLVLPEPFNKNVGITVTDNPSVLKIPLLAESMRSVHIAARYGVKTLESYVGQQDISDREIASKLFTSRQTQQRPLVKVKTQDSLTRKSVGNGLVLTLPPESVIPVFIPGEVERQIGVFVAIDLNGNPVSRNSETDYYAAMRNKVGSADSFASSMIERARQNASGFDTWDTNTQYDYTARLWGELLDQDLMARIRNGVYGAGAKIARNDDFYQLMIVRQLALQQTQLLYLPIELVTYFAFRYGDDGVGKSILDGMKVLNGLRCMLTVSNALVSVKNSIGRTKVSVKLDPRDPDPKKTIELIAQEVMRLRQQAIPIGMSNPLDITEWMGKASIEFAYTGHEGIPDVDIEFSESSTNYPKADTELDQDLRKRSIMKFSVPPEAVEGMGDVNFATTVVSQNLMLSKQAMEYQMQFCPMLEDHLRKVALAAEYLLADLREIVAINYDKIVAKLEKNETNGKNENIPLAANKEVLIDCIVYAFVKGFNVTLPSPDTITLSNQMEGLKEFEEALDHVLDVAYLGDDLLSPDAVGDLGAYTRTMRANVKANYVRDWLAQRGVLPELNDLLKKDETGKPIVEVYKNTMDNITALAGSLGYWMSKIEKIKAAATDAMEANHAEPSETPTNSEPENGNNENDLFGGDDLFGAGEEPDEPTPEEGTPPEEPEANPNETPEPAPEGTKEEPEQ